MSDHVHSAFASIVSAMEYLENARLRVPDPSECAAIYRAKTLLRRALVDLGPPPVVAPDRRRGGDPMPPWTMSLAR